MDEQQRVAEALHAFLGRFMESPSGVLEGDVVRFHGPSGERFSVDADGTCTVDGPRTTVAFAVRTASETGEWELLTSGGRAERLRRSYFSAASLAGAGMFLLVIPTFFLAWISFDGFGPVTAMELAAGVDMHVLENSFPPNRSEGDVRVPPYLPVWLIFAVAFAGSATGFLDDRRGYYRLRMGVAVTGFGATVLASGLLSGQVWFSWDCTHGVRCPPAGVVADLGQFLAPAAFILAGVMNFKLAKTWDRREGVGPVLRLLLGAAWRIGAGLLLLAVLIVIWLEMTVS